MWGNKVGEDEANRIMTVSSARGTQMHKYIEEYLVGQSRLELTSEINEPKLMSNEIIRNGLCNLNELWGAEVTLSFPSFLWHQDHQINSILHKQSFVFLII